MYIDKNVLLPSAVTLCTIGLLSCNSKQDVSKEADKPNIIYIYADDLGYGDLGCYGQEKIETPYIDKMAKEGILFTNHYSGSTVCAPSRSCLMTGQHTGHTTVRGNARVPLLEEDTTVAELLKQAGYKTALMGKWGLGEPGTSGIPNKQGFDYFVGYLNQRHAHNAYPAYLWKNQDSMLLDNKVIYDNGKRNFYPGGVSTNKKTHSHDVFTSEALNFIKQNKDKPFFVYLAYTLPHANNEAGAFGKIGMECPDTTLYADKDWPEVQKAHAGTITYMDKDVGKILKLLKELSIDENTLVIFTSDNGPHAEGGVNPEFFNSSGPFRGIKRDLYDGGIRIPMIARWPGKIKPEQETSHISAQWDFLPTVCDITGVKPPENIDGISYLPALLGEEQPEHDYLYWEFYEMGTRQAIRKGKWKAIKYDISSGEDVRFMLFDIENDPSETNDLSTQHPELMKEFDGIINNAYSTPYYTDFYTAYLHYEPISKDFFFTKDGKNGLTAEYYQGADFDKLMYKKIDDNVDFSWNSKSPEKLPADFFSIRWSGKIKVPKTGEFEFYTLSDDGIKVWIDNELIIEKWEKGVYRCKGVFEMQEGKMYNIKIEYYEDTGGAGITLGWKIPG